VGDHRKISLFFLNPFLFLDFAVGVPNLQFARFFWRRLPLASGCSFSLYSHLGGRESLSAPNRDPFNPHYVALSMFLHRGDCFLPDEWVSLPPLPSQAARIGTSCFPPPYEDVTGAVFPQQVMTSNSSFVEGVAKVKTPPSRQFAPLFLPYRCFL